MVSLSFVKYKESNNPGSFIVKAVLTGNYGTILIGDLLNMEVYSAANLNGITDPTSAYDEILAIPTSNVGIFAENIGGSYCQITPPAVGTPLTLQNLGLRVFEPGGTEKATNAAYVAAELAGYVLLEILIPKL